jgi:hypothetical protein
VEERHSGRAAVRVHRTGSAVKREREFGTCGRLAQLLANGSCQAPLIPCDLCLCFRQPATETSDVEIDRLSESVSVVPGKVAGPTGVVALSAMTAL